MGTMLVGWQTSRLFYALLTTAAALLGVDTSVKLAKIPPVSVMGET